MTVQAATTTAETHHEPPFNIALVEEMLRLLARAVRAHQLYLHNNPTYLRALEVLRASFEPIWLHTDRLVFEVTDTQLRWEGVAVINEPDKTSDALPWTLYKDGIRELQLARGIEEREIVAFVQLIARVRKASPDVDDLLTLLWEQEFTCIRYRYVDVSFESAAPIEALDEPAEPRLVDPKEVAAPPTEQVIPPGVVNLDDFSSALYFLDEQEVEYLKEGIREEYASELRANVVAILLDVFEQQPDPSVRDEICGILDGLLVSLLTGGQLSTVAYLLREVGLAANRARQITEQQRTMLLSLANRMSEPEALAQLIQSLDERVDVPAQEDLNALFDQLHAGALGTLLAWIGLVQSPRLRQLLEGAAARLAEGHTGELVRLIGSSERPVMLEAVRRAGALKAQAAVPALAKLVIQPEAATRLAAVQALAEIATPGALQQLERMLDDPERDVRVAALRAFSNRLHRPALQKLETAIKTKRVHTADLTEKMALFEAYGAMCGDEGVPLLDGYLNSKGLFGRRADPELRACAAMALGRIGTAAALAALNQASMDKEILVRNAVAKARRGGAR